MENHIKRIAFVVVAGEDVELVRVQLKAKGITNVDVLKSVDDTSKYDIVKTGVIPNKEDCLVLDLANSLKEHGFAETVRSFDIKDKVAYKEQKEDCSVDELPDVIDGDGKVTSSKVIEYRIEQKQQRIDKLLEDNQLLKLQLDRSHKAVEDATRLEEQLRIERLTSEAIQSRLTAITEDNRKVKAEVAYLRKHVPNVEVLLDNDARLETLFATVSDSSSKSFMPKYLAALEGYTIVGNPTPSQEDVYNLSKVIRKAKCPYIQKSLTTKLLKNIDNEESIDLLDFAKWVEREYTAKGSKKSFKRQSIGSSWYKE